MNNKGCWWSVRVEAKGLKYTLQWMGRKQMPLALKGMVERDKGKVGRGSEEEERIRGWRGRGW